jgi:hypothetical protein
MTVSEGGRFKMSGFSLALGNIRKGITYVLLNCSIYAGGGGGGFLFLDEARMPIILFPFKQFILEDLMESIDGQFYRCSAHDRDETFISTASLEVKRNKLRLFVP